MSWQEYHRARMPITFSHQSEAYLRAIEGLRQINVDLLAPNTTPTIVLGGFHNPWSVADFHKLCDKLQTGPQRRVLLDLQASPLQTLDGRGNPHRVQARLEELPFPGESIDLLFLDYTTDFMNDRTLRRFSLGINDILKPVGLVLAAFMDTDDQSLWDSIEERLTRRVPTYCRSSKKFCQLMTPLRPIIGLSFPVPYRYISSGSLGIFARGDSSLPQFRGKLILGSSE